MKPQFTLDGPTKPPNNFKATARFLMISLAFLMLGAESFASKSDSLRSVVYADTSSLSTQLKTYYQWSNILKNSSKPEDLKELHNYRRLAYTSEEPRQICTSLQQLAHYYQNRAEFDSTLHYIHAYREIAQAKDLPNTQVTGHLQMANIFMLQGKTDTALSYYLKGKNLALEIGDSTRLATGLIGEAMCLNVKGNQERAVEILNRATLILRKTGFVENEAFCYHYIGYIFHQNEEFKKSINYFKKAAQLRKKTENEHGHLLSIVSIGMAFYGLNELDSAATYYKAALPGLEKIQDNSSLPTVYTGLSDFYRNQGNLDSSRYFIDKALTLAKSLDLRMVHLQAGIENANLYLMENQAKKAHQALEDVRHLTESGDFPALSTSWQITLAKSYAQEGKYDSAYDALLQGKTLTDSLNRSEALYKISKLEAKFQLEEQARIIAEKESQMALDKAALAKAQKRNWILACIAFGLLVFAVFWYLNYQLKAQARKELEAKALEIQAINEDLKASNTQLQELNLEKNNLISIVAHDLKSPFNNIIGMVKLLQSKTFPEEKKERMLEMIKSSAESVGNMINQILDLNKIESNVLKINRSPCDVSQISELIVERFQLAAKTKSIRVESDIQDNIMALADENFFHQVVENILSNALKFSRSSSKIQVALRDEADKIILAVHDEGPGIDPNLGEKVFEQNVTGNAKPTADESSSGIGLAIVKRFVEAMGGKVWFESQLGEGTSFYVSLDKA